jgi:hypothetical protein
MAAVQNLCTTGIVLADGQVVCRGTALEASEFYLASANTRDFGLVDLTKHPGRTGEYRPIVRSIGLLSQDDVSRYTGSVKPGDDLVFEIQYDTGGLALDNAVLGIHTSHGERLFTVGARFSADFKFVLRGKGTVTCRVPRIALNAGEYRVMVAMGNRMHRQDIDCVEDALTFRVESVDYFGTGEVLLPGQGWFAVRSEWRLASMPEQPADLRDPVSVS